MSWINSTDKHKTESIKTFNKIESIIQNITMNYTKILIQNRNYFSNNVQR